MIGGSDVIIPAVGDPAALEAYARIIGRHWPDARFEDAITGKKYRSVGGVPFQAVSELLLYPDPRAEAAWDADSPDSPENSMISLIFRPEEITVVLHDPTTPQMSSILDEIHRALSTAGGRVEARA